MIEGDRRGERGAPNEGVLAAPLTLVRRGSCCRVSSGMRDLSEERRGGTPGLVYEPRAYWRVSERSVGARSGAEGGEEEM